LRRAERKAGRVGSGDLDAARILDTGHGSRQYGRLGGQKQSRVTRARVQSKMWTTDIHCPCCAA
jgi:hypothetical protein